MGLYILYSSTCFLFIFLLINFCLKNNLALDNDFTKPQSIHNKRIPRVLGISFILLFSLSFYFNYPNYLNFIILTSLICSLPGFFEDFNININPTLRFLFQILSLSVCIYFFNDVNILTSLEFVPDVLNNKYFLTIFTIFAITTIVNSFNFIDGLDGLLILYCILIFTFLFLFTNNLFYNNYLLIFILHLIIILLFNYPKSYAFTGDFGCYFLGYLISLLFIYFHNNFAFSNFNLNDWFFANLLAYPAFEILSTVIRRLVNRKSPFYPDNLHTHSLLNKYILQKYKYKKSFVASTCIIIALIFLLLPLFLVDKDYWSIYFFLQIIIFFLFRFKLSKMA